MDATGKRNLLIGFYVAVLFLLLLSVVATPILVHRGLPLTRHLLVAEDIVEAGLIALLFGISFFIGKGFMRTLKTDRQVIERSAEERTTLVSRLAEAFNYIGSVNVEIQEIASLLCGVTCYPQSKKAFKQMEEKMAVKAMTIAAAPWLVVRMIDRHHGQTLGEQAVRRPGVKPPAPPLGNRAILDERPVDGMHTIRTRQQNLDILTVFILPPGEMSNEQTILLSAILNQLEMLFLLFHTGCLKPAVSTHSPRKEAPHESHH